MQNSMRRKQREEIAEADLMEVRYLQVEADLNEKLLIFRYLSTS